MLLPFECAARLQEERGRLGYSVEQTAVLGGMTTSAYLQVESGTVAMPYLVLMTLARHGFRADYIHHGGDDSGEQTPPGSEVFEEIKRADKLSFTEMEEAQFRDALTLLRRSVAAVDAFFGPGKAKQAPQLVSTLVQTTLAFGEQIDKAQKMDVYVETDAVHLAKAIREAAGTIAEAMQPGQ